MPSRIWTTVKRGSLIGLSLLLSTFCFAVGSAAGKPLPFEVLQRFEHSRLLKPEQRLIQSPAEWNLFWKTHAQPGQPQPEIDFKTQAVIVILMGEKPTPGYSSCVKSLQLTPAPANLPASAPPLIQLELEQQTPDPDQFMPQVSTSPGCLVRIARQPQAELAPLNSTATPERNILPMRTLSLLTNSQILSPRRVVARDLETFRSLWLEHGGSPESLPEIDFKQEMVIGLFMGEQPTGGYAIEIARITEDNQQLTAWIKTREPNPDQMVIQILTAPAHLVATPIRDLPLNFSELQGE